MIKVIDTQKIPEWIPYPEGETTQRQEMRAYTRLYDLYYEEDLIIFI